MTELEYKLLLKGIPVYTRYVNAASLLLGSSCAQLLLNAHSLFRALMHMLLSKIFLLAKTQRDVHISDLRGSKGTNSYLTIYLNFDVHF